MGRAVFLDRDGTINDHTTGYVTKPDGFRFLPGALDALKRLSQTDYRIIVVTNQSAVSRGLLTLDGLERLHEMMIAEVSGAGGRIDAVYVCAHPPEDDCACRKPKTLLLELAAETYGLDLKGSWLVGDKTVDLMTGRNAGCRTILVGTGYGGSDCLHEVMPDFRAKDLAEAAGIILSSP